MSENFEKAGTNTCGGPTKIESDLLLKWNFVSKPFRGMLKDRMALKTIILHMNYFGAVQFCLYTIRNLLACVPSSSNRDR